MANRTQIIIAAAAFFAGGDLLRASQDPADGITVIVRVYDAARISGSERTAALDLAASTLATAGVKVSWRLCTRKTRSECDLPLGPGELAFRIVRSRTAADDVAARVLGDSFIDPDVHQGTLATVYYDRVLALSREARIGRAFLLGQAVAHELGHLLMGTSSHSAAGLMRGTWRHDELTRGRASDWEFAPDDVDTIKRRLRDRPTSISKSIGFGRAVL